MLPFQINIPGSDPIVVAMGRITGGHCIVGPPKALTRIEAVFTAFLTAFEDVKQRCGATPGYRPLVVLLTPSDHADSLGWDAHRVVYDDGYEFFPTKLSGDVLRALREAEAFIGAA